MENPKYFERCLRHLFDMIIKCNARICIQGMDTDTAERDYKATKPGANYAETQTNEERAWTQLCRVHGNATPTTKYHRVEFLLMMCAKYQGHSKTKRTLLKALHNKGITLTSVPFSVAIPIIGGAARFEDEINAQMDTGVVSPAAVNTVGATEKRAEQEATRGAGTGVETCNICDKPGHNARDCLLSMHREGTCGHWFMHSIGNYRIGCTYGHACKNKHE